MQSGERRVVEKAYAYVTRDGGEELLVFEPPAGEAPQVPKGGVEDGEVPREAVVRELREETGLGDAVLRARLGRDEWPHPEKPKTYRRHFFHLSARDAPDEWVHEVTGAGEDCGERYACSWMARGRAAEELVRDQGVYVPALTAGEDASRP